MGYYLDRGEEVIFDTNRTWTGKINLLGELFPGAKVICLCEDIPSILERWRGYSRRTQINQVAYSDSILRSVSMRGWTG